MGDEAGAKASLEEMLAYAEALPDGQRPAATIAGLRKELGLDPAEAPKQ
jgi:hypothetical protein